MLEGFTNTKVAYVVLPGASFSYWFDEMDRKLYISADLAMISPGSGLTFLKTGKETACQRASRAA